MQKQPPEEFWEISRNTFFTEHLRTTASENDKDLKDIKDFYFALNKLQKKLKSIYLANYKYYLNIVDKIISPNSNLCIAPKNKTSMFSFPSLILK